MLTGASLEARPRPGSPGPGHARVASPFLDVRGLRKQFGGAPALKGVDFSIAAGEIHGLVGENGAGKSTMIRILAGVHRPDAGEILLDGESVDIRSPQDAGRLGLSFIHQELNLVPRFRAFENVTLGLPKPRRAGLIDWRALRRDAQHAADRIGIHFSLETPVEELSVADRWLVSIARALVRRARFIAMDEPTASLSAEEGERLHVIVRELAADGIAIVYVSHRLDEILDLSDRVTVFRDGERVSTVAGREATRRGLIRDIVGHEVAAPTPPAPREETEALLELASLSRGSSVRDVSLRLEHGEILGLAGLVGAGRTELARLLFGADQPDVGEIVLDGRPLRLRSPYDAVKAGIAYVPEERRSQGLLLEKSVAFNVTLPFLGSYRPLRHLPFVNLRRARANASLTVDELEVRPRGVDRAVGELSGGNQQKVVIGKWLRGGSLRLLILDEPSRGVDVGARAEIHAIIARLAASGVGVIVISSEFEELVGLCHRVLVLVEGRVAGELRGAEITNEAILHLCYRETEGAAA